LLAGCIASKPAESESWLKRFQTLQGPTGPDVVQMDVALIERQVGDAYLNRDLWQVVDEQTLGPECKAALDDNGFRVGQVGGIPPAGLQAFLTSASSCANPRRIKLHAGNPTTLMVGSLRPACRFQIMQAGSEPVPVTLEQAQCTLVVLPTLTRDGHIRLHFDPQILHGETMLLPYPVPESSRWVLQEQRPTERYPALGFEITVAPNEYVVVGGMLDKPETLGHQYFVCADGTRPGQQLLVIRAGRGAGEALPDPLADGSEGETAPSAAVVPLALQATLPSAARASSR
jgi:hypothetical protein